MTSFRKVLSLLFLLVYDAEGIQSYAKIYDQSYFKGYVGTLHSSWNNLKGSIFEKRVTSANVSGIWAFFRYPDFNQDKDPLLSFILWGKGAASGHLGSLAGSVTSVRLLGGVEDIIPNLRIYDGTYFTGAEKIIFRSTPAMHHQHTSLILKNCQAWTIYSEINYEGFSVCLLPGERSETCTPWFFFDQEDYRLLSIRSIRKGCHSSFQVERNKNGL
ncbi:Gamma-crystallin A [Caligus rogercresseyi]|uniref:Gamma-crystallin A n=1 Tax=Caligus rogercresseyi TaxID=217165 RepID=A0A7T8GZ25_CALRO|nr:Gamma-crystallin A [Caligus rogercresseyi]